ncbi:hypothetical protein Ddye_022526 [Dipteronia dyeriana]|uniref:Germin-like protein n=1 Tax=Dipteronia dyeriana TaxID=168575 RepID=A0AAD9TS59_9ROSI|nr:hypothetical protein Ddye_022526 [Dipteronia dyeriana]
MASLKDFQLMFFLAVFATVAWLATAGDPDILTDFVVPPNSLNSTDGNLFTFTGMRGIFENLPSTFKVTKAAMAEFPVLNGQSVSMAVLQFPTEGLNPPHTHPRSAELLFLIEGCLEVGFVDTTNKLFVQNLQVGDIFVFPKGLVHYQYNADTKIPAIAISAFGSANAGTVSVPLTVFGTGISDGILAKAFKTDVATVQKIKAGLVPKP